MSKPTHAKINDDVHVVATIEESSGAAHSHRVRFACGMLFDVRGEHQFIEHAVAGVAPSVAEEEKLRKAAIDAHQVADDHRTKLLALLEKEPPRPPTKPGETQHPIVLSPAAAQAELNFTGAYRAAAEAIARFHAARTPAVHQRWITTDKAVARGCEHCVAVEAGEAKPIPAPAIARVVKLADIQTGISCPDCGTEIRIRRYEGGAACTGQGHEYTFPEVQQVAVGLLHRLATGDLFGKKEG